MRGLISRTSREILPKILVLFCAAFSTLLAMAVVARDGHFLRVNPALCTLVGYPGSQIHKLTFQDITHPADLEADLENLEKLVRGDSAGYEMEKRYFHRDGSVVWIHLDVSAVRDNSGQPICFGIRIQDLTKRKEEEASLMEELLRRLSHENASDLPRSPAGVHLVANPEILLTKRDREVLAQMTVEVHLSSLKWKITAIGPILRAARNWPVSA